MRAPLVLSCSLGAVVCALPAAGQASGPRNLAMGGTGVASSDPWSAPFTNPALTRFRDEDKGLSVAFPFLSVAVRDDQELLDGVDEFQDSLDLLQRQIDAFDPAALVQRSVTVSQISALDRKALDGEGEIGLAVLAPREHYTASLWMRTRADARAFPMITQSDIDLISDPTSTSIELDTLTSEAVVIAAERTEFGATFAVEGLLTLGEKARRVSFGITPKIQWIKTYNFAQLVTEFEDSDVLGELRDDVYERSSSAINFDLGLAMELEKGATLGFAVRDVFREDHPTVLTNGRRFSYRVQPRPIVGVAVERAGLSFAADLDLARSKRFVGTPSSQYFRMGVEADVFGQAQLRAGFAHDFANGQADLVSVGLGISPAETVRIDLVGQFGDSAVGAGLQVALTL